MAAEQLVPTGRANPAPFYDVHLEAVTEVLETGSWSGAESSEYEVRKVSNPKGVEVFMGPDGHYIGQYVLVKRHEDEKGRFVPRVLKRLGLINDKGGILL